MSRELQPQQLTREMVEAGARAYYDAETEVQGYDPPWDGQTTFVKAEYLKAAEIVLTAALGRTERADA